MEDTLRYFFSAVFQGFAAIISLGAMFYVFYKQTMNDKLNMLENSIYQHLSADILSEVRIEIETHGLIKVAEDKLNSTTKPTKNLLSKHIMEYNKIKNNVDSLPSKLKTIVWLITSVLIFSLISLILVEINDKIINYLLCSSIIILILSIVVLIFVVNFILLIIKQV